MYVFTIERFERIKCKITHVSSSLQDNKVFMPLSQ